MCLTKLSAKDEKAALSKLPDVFPCWKIIREDYSCEYDLRNRQPKLTRGTHIAQDLPVHRSLIDYRPGFHAFLEKPRLRNIFKQQSYSFPRFRVVKCWADKVNIIRIGLTKYEQYMLIGSPRPLSIAVSKITRK